MRVTVAIFLDFRGQKSDFCSMWRGKIRKDLEKCKTSKLHRFRGRPPETPKSSWCFFEPQKAQKKTKEESLCSFVSFVVQEISAPGCGFATLCCIWFNKRAEVQANEAKQAFRENSRTDLLRGLKLFSNHLKPSQTKSSST
jgi:hypothetical protein